MPKRTRKTRTLTSALIALAPTAALVGTGAPVAAYNPDPKPYFWTADTSNCPCWNGDPADGTHVKYDKGGRAKKIELWKNGRMVGKVEFHPNDEQIWAYDTANDGDRLYVRWRFKESTGHSMSGSANPPSTGNTIDKTVRDLNIKEGTKVDVTVYDGPRKRDYIAGTRGEA